MAALPGSACFLSQLVDSAFGPPTTASFDPGRPRVPRPPRAERNQTDDSDHAQQQVQGQKLQRSWNTDHLGNEGVHAGDTERASGSEVVRAGGRTVGELQDRQPHVVSDRYGSWVHHLGIHAEYDVARLQSVAGKGFQEVCSASTGVGVDVDDGAPWNTVFHEKAGSTKL